MVQIILIWPPSIRGSEWRGIIPITSAVWSTSRLSNRTITFHAWRYPWEISLGNTVMVMMLSSIFLRKKNENVTVPSFFKSRWYRVPGRPGSCWVIWKLCRCARFITALRQDDIKRRKCIKLIKHFKDRHPDQMKEFKQVSFNLIFNI